MRRLYTYGLIAVAVMLFQLAVSADEFVLSNGNTYRGELSAYDENGILIRLDSGGFTERIHWVRLSQETLKRLSQDPDIEEYTFAFIDIPPDEVTNIREISVTDPESIKRPAGDLGFIARLMTPAGLLIIGMLFLTNLFAAFEIAKYKNRPVAIVCAASAILPVIVPLAFLFLPSEEGDYSDEPVQRAAVEGGPEVSTANPAAQSKLGLSGGKGEAPAASGSSLEGQVWQRGETEFNRRFFEITFVPFFKVVPPPEVKNLVIAVRAGRQEYVARRISRISAKEVYLQPQSGGEQGVPFAKIDEIKVRNKNAKA